MSETIYSLFQAAASRAPDAPAIWWKNGAVTFGELSCRVEQEAARLAPCLPPGAVPIPHANSPDYPVTFLAAASLGRPAFTAGPLPYLSVMSAAYEPGELLWGATSGSTGSLKFYARSHASWIESFRSCEAVFPLHEQDVICIPGTLTHSLFLYAALHALTRGLPIALVQRFSAKAVLQLLRAHPATILYTVPAMLFDLLRAGQEIPPLRMIFVGGDRLRSTLRQALRERMPQTEIVEFYGASETSFISYKSTSHPAPEPSAGRLFPGVRAEIRSRNGAVLPMGLIGVITVASPMVFSRYVGEPAAGEWVTAGDLGVFDSFGLLYLIGRADREVNSKGAKISPERVEAVLSTHGSISHVAVIGLADERRGQRLVAAIEFRDAPPARAALSAFCRDHLPDGDCPQAFYSATSLPRTRGGKIAFAVLQRELETGSANYRLMT